MYNFKKLIGLAGAGMVFTTLAFGQATCTAPTSNAILIRAEGVTEQVSNLTFTCTNNTAAAIPANAAGVSVSVFLSPSIPVTSKVLSTTAPTAGLTEAVILVDSTTTPAAQGSVTGSTISFNAVPTPAIPAGGSVVFTIANVRVNASTLTVGSGVPPAITETVFVSGPAVSANALATTQVAFATPGLRTTTNFTTAARVTAGSNNRVICQAINPVAGPAGGILTVLNVGENFATAFKDRGTVAGNATVGNEFTNNTESGFIPAVWPNTPGADNRANTATRVKVVFTNIPAGLTLYVPVVIAGDQAGSGTLTLFSSETGGNAVTAAAASGTLIAGLASVSGTAVYQFAPGANSTATAETFAIPVYGVANANSVTSSSTGLGIAVSYAPVGSSNIPNFVIGSSTNAIVSSIFNRCTTSLLFPYVTNQLGFDTGIAISNTSADPFGPGGATAQAGTCVLNFYGVAPPASPVTTASVASGTVYTAVLSSQAAGFQGYIIAQCNFQFAHGFAFITNGIGANGGLSQGYLAGVIPDTNQKARAADPLSVAAAGTGETLGN